jgi:general secretion pathway protein J
MMAPLWLPWMALQVDFDMKGFTLLEVLVALSIFAVIGMGTNQLLRTVIDTRDATESRTGQLKDVQRAIALLERDFSQIVNRPIRNELGDRMPSLQIGYGLYDIEFTRLGWRNPRSLPRSNVQRVAYKLNEGELERHYWLILDRAEDSEPRVQKILSDVEDFRIHAVDENGNASDNWSGDLGVGSQQSDEGGLDNSFGGSGSTLPEALEVFIQIEQLGEIRKVVNLVTEAQLSQVNNQGDNQDQDQDAEQTEEEEARGTRRRGRYRDEEDEDE